MIINTFSYLWKSTAIEAMSELAQHGFKVFEVPVRLPTLLAGRDVGKFALGCEKTTAGLRGKCPVAKCWWLRYQPRQPGCQYEAQKHRPY